MFQIPYRNDLSSFNLSNERTTHLLSLLIVIIFLLFFFFFFFSLFHAMQFLPLTSFEEFSPCPLSLPLSFAQIAFSVFNLVGSFCLNFYLGRPFEFSTQQAFSFFFFFFQMWYLRSLSLLIGRSISSPSKSVILVAPPDMIFLIIKGPDHPGFIFHLGSKVSSLSTFRTKSLL